jgi:hypothetical protein
MNPQFEFVVKLCTNTILSIGECVMCTWNFAQRLLNFFEILWQFSQKEILNLFAPVLQNVSHF